MDLIDIYRTFHLKAAEYTFFSSTHRTFSRIDHILGHKASLNKFKKTEIISSIFSSHNGKHPKDATRKLLELINEFGKFAEYKINTHKSVAFLYINNERSEREIKETTPFTIISKGIKHLGINLPKEVKDLYSKNYKIDRKSVV